MVDPTWYALPLGAVVFGAVIFFVARRGQIQFYRGIARAERNRAAAIEASRTQASNQPQAQ